jgi:hypothetical protein
LWLGEKSAELSVNKQEEEKENNGADFPTQIIKLKQNLYKL